MLKDLESDADEEIDSEAESEDTEHAHDESGARVWEDMEQAADRDT